MAKYFLLYIKRRGNSATENQFIILYCTIINWNSRIYKFEISLRFYNHFNNYLEMRNLFKINVNNPLILIKILKCKYKKPKLKRKYSNIF